MHPTPQDVCNNTLNVTTYFSVDGYRTVLPDDQTPATQGTCYAGEACDGGGTLTVTTGSKLTAGSSTTLGSSSGTVLNNWAGRAVPAAGVAAIAAVLGAMALLL